MHSSATEMPDKPWRRKKPTFVPRQNGVFV